MTDSGENQPLKDGERDSESTVGTLSMSSRGSESSEISSPESDIKKGILQPGGLDGVVDFLNTRALESLNAMSGPRKLIDRVRMGAQTRLSEKPPIFDVKPDFEQVNTTERKGFLGFLGRTAARIRNTGQYAKALLEGTPIQHLDESGIKQEIPANKVNGKIFSDFKNIINNAMEDKGKSMLGKIASAAINTTKYAAKTLLNGVPIEYNDEKGEKKTAQVKFSSVIMSRPLARIISYRGRQTAGAIMTMGVHLANFPFKTAALIGHTAKINVISASMAFKGETELCNKETLTQARKDRKDTFKNWFISAVAVTGTVASAGLATGAAPIVAAVHSASASTHITAGMAENIGIGKKILLMGKEEAEHLSDLTKTDKQTQMLAAAEKALNTSNLTGQEQKMESALQKKASHLQGELNPIISPERKESIAKLPGIKSMVNKFGIKIESREELKKRIDEKTSTTQAHHENMKKILTEHTDKKTGKIVIPTSPKKRQELLQAQTYAGLSGNR